MVLLGRIIQSFLLLKGTSMSINPDDRGPTYYLKKYKTTERPRPCRVCDENAYYYRDDLGYMCAPHFLDLINVGEVLFRWDCYPEMWNRMEKLLNRSSGVNLIRRLG